MFFLLMLWSGYKGVLNSHFHLRDHRIEGCLHFSRKIRLVCRCIMVNDFPNLLSNRMTLRLRFILQVFRQLTQL